MRRLGLDPEIVNNDGGAIAWGTRWVPAAPGSPSPCWAGWSAKTREIGLATMCIGVGQGTAMLLERV